jgi:cobalamin synthase
VNAQLGKGQLVGAMLLLLLLSALLLKQMQQRVLLLATVAVETAHLALSTLRKVQVPWQQMQADLKRQVCQRRMYRQQSACLLLTLLPLQQLLSPRQLQQP